MPYQQTTLASLLISLAYRYESKPFWTAAEATAALNEGLRVWNALTGYWVGTFYQNTIPSDPWVAVPGSLTQATRVLFNGIPMEKASQADLDYGIPNWRGAVSGTTGHPSRPSYWATVAMNLLVIYPADAAGLNSLEVSGVRATVILVAPTDYLDLGEEQVNLLLDYALHHLLFKIGGQSFVQSYPGWLNFLRAGAKENRGFAASTFYRRVLGLDAQRTLFPSRRQVTNPVDEVLSSGVSQDAQAVTDSGTGG